jgi:ubiquitin carboxyl-terminal hydrolase 22/27/51
VTPGGKKRKLGEHTPEDSRLVSANTANLDCDIDGIRGLYNLGQSCYINALLQCFLHNPFLRAYFLSDFHRANTCEIEHCMTCALDDIFKDFYGTKKLEGVAPLKVLEVTWRQNAVGEPT